ncbi:MAG TPA: TonB-dependent receptor [Vicinamibacteria bacterium]|nr:TonB-dependent receptor [Vicinamibacteria bacterium]
MLPSRFRIAGRALAALALLLVVAGPVPAQEPGRVRVTGTVRDLQTSGVLPGVTVEVVGAGITTVTDVDGRYILDLAPGKYTVKTSLLGFQDRTVDLTVEAGSAPTVDVGMALQAYAESVTVVGEVEAAAASAEAQLIERKNAPVITDNLGAEDMKANADSDAASAMSRVTGISVVDNQYVFVRGLGERYSNTTLSGAVVPSTEPDKKVVALDLFPSGLLDSVQIAKSFSPDRSAEFAGGLVQIRPLRLPSRRVLDVSIGGSYSTNATGEDILVSPLGGQDRFGFDDGARALPAGFPTSKIVRRGIYSPEVGYTREEITAFGRQLENRWRPETRSGKPGQSFSIVYGERVGGFGFVLSLSQSYKEEYFEEDRRFFRIADEGELEAVSDYHIRTGSQKAQLGGVANLAYQFSPNHRLALESFYAHSGRDEGRVFQGANTENNFIYRNERLQFIEEGLLSGALVGEHFFPEMSNSRVDWRASYARASRDEPDLREALYQQACVSGTACTQGTGDFLLADESQSGFRMFNDLEDDTLDLGLNWNFVGSRARATLFKFGANYVHRTRDFTSRRFRFVPNTANTGGAVGINLSQAPETLFAAGNIGPIFRFNEETRPVDAYSGDQETMAGYGMVDVALTDRLRLVGGARVERFEQNVDTFDPFGLFVGRVETRNEYTDVFPGLNLIYALRPDMNLRLGGSVTTNRPEFRELAPFEFTDVVGSRAIRGNPELTRALIRSADARWELLPGGRDVLAVSAFFKQFDDPVERVVIAGAQPIVTYQNAQQARNVGFELEAARQFTTNVFFNLNYTFVDSKITLSPEQRTVQTSLERPLAGQSDHVLNAIGEVAVGGFSTRFLFNFFGDRISDVGANQAPDVIEQGRATLDAVVTQRIGRLSVKLAVENLTDETWTYTQGDQEQRVYRPGRTIGLSLGVDLY